VIAAFRKKKPITMKVLGPKGKRITAKDESASLAVRPSQRLHVLLLENPKINHFQILPLHLRPLLLDPLAAQHHSHNEDTYSVLRNGNPSARSGSCRHRWDMDKLPTRGFRQRLPSGYVWESNYFLFFGSEVSSDP
jgi:hypothetical protein